MALDKQMILSELGSVMNKLQSADCGCMGKLFTQGQNANQGGQNGVTMGYPLPTCGGCRRGCCQGHGYGGYSQGYSAPYAGEPYYKNNPNVGNNQCSPRRLYADTYNYLSSNFMKPVVQEVYQDLKSINPDNSVVNNPMASQMGLQQQGRGASKQGHIDMAQNQMPGSNMGASMQDPNMFMNQEMGNQQMGNQQMGYQQMGNQQMGYQQGYQQMGDQQMGDQQMGDQQMGDQQMGDQQMGNQQMGSQQMENQQMGQMMSGMGPNIVNMMQGDTKSPFGQKTGAMSTPTAHSQDPGSISHEHYIPGMSNNASNYGGQQAQSHYMQQQNMSNAMDPNSQNTFKGNMHQNNEQPPATYKVNYSNPAAQQMSSNRNHQRYGQHTAGVSKFNEMFPGVMGGMGGDLGFDPMAIAIQMNPANQQQAAMGQMEKLMSNNPVERILDTKNMQPALTGANTAAAAINPKHAQNIPPSNQQTTPVHPGVTQNLQQGYSNMAADQPNQASQQVYGQVPQKQRQLVYTAATSNQNQAPQHQQQTPQQQYQQQPTQQYQQNVDPNVLKYQQQQQQQQYVDPNAQAMVDPNAATDQQPLQGYSASPSAPGQMIKEPIMPAETRTMQFNRHYNTLGQPVDMLPGKMFHPEPDTNMQQTLSPQPVTRMRNDPPKTYVKNTVSKTSLMGNRPVGRTPSRGQLQQIYNQYKGSHSYTQQNIRPPVQGTTFSDGKINVALASTNQQRHVPVERVGGDTLDNNQIKNRQVQIEDHPMGTGDVPMAADNKPHGDIIPNKEPVIKKCRNGLQDVVFTSYQTSAAPAWSFHGINERAPYAPGHRLRG